MSDRTGARRFPVGAEVVGTGVDFRVWAPGRRRVAVVTDNGADLPLEREDDGYHHGFLPDAGAGMLYRFRLDDDEKLYPDPASRFQPDGPHGPSQVVDPDVFVWSDADWMGVEPDRAVIYELHVGTFTTEGKWEAASGRLEDLADLGVTLIEVMPIADFPGRFGWGYDGVDFFAPTRLYGAPDDFRRFVDRAHALGIGVILDVVYNHLGPDGNYLPQFSEHYFTDRHETEWGDPIDFDGPRSEPVREFFVTNAAYWITEYHLDGLRLDATQNIYDSHHGEEHILARITRAARVAAGERRIFIVAENEPQDTKLVRPPVEGGYGVDAMWNDDYHHSAMVALTGRKEAYYTDYLGKPQEFVSAATGGFLYQGQYYSWQKKPRGTPTAGLPLSAFVVYLQNHDQVANSARGERIHQLTSPGRLRALTALTLLGPATPMLFMGQEFAASTPFLYFADHAEELARNVERGRREFLRQFPSLALPELQAGVDEPADPATFERSRLDPADREGNAPMYALHRDLLRLRREDGVIPHAPVDGAVLSGEAFVLRFRDGEGDDRLLIVNLGRDLVFSPAPEPLLAPPPGGSWRVIWASDAPEYGGSGSPEPCTATGEWRLHGESAVVLGAGRL